jgi:catechol O-methyltransferase
MMHIGNQKMKYLDMVAQMIPSSADLMNHGAIYVEIGSYCGYSAVKLASLLNKERGDRLYCIESEPKCVQWTLRMLDMAGLLDRVHVIRGAVNAASLEELKDTLQRVHERSTIDALFVDHDKKLYLQDLQLIEGSGLLRSGSIVAADNVMSFGRPLEEYLAHVRNPAGNYASSEFFLSYVEYANAEDVPDPKMPPESLGGDIDPFVIDGIEISILR